jgi:hypothetical protein
MRRFWILVTAPCLLLPSLLLSQAAPARQSSFDQVAAAINRNCSRCHFQNTSGPNARQVLALDDITASEEIALEAPASWKKIYSRVVESRSMPPSGSPMTDADRAVIQGWIETHFGSALAPEWRTLRRLTNDEYNRAIRELFGLDLDVASRMQPDSLQNGFANNAAVAFNSIDGTYQYLATSRFVAESILGLNDLTTSKSEQWTAAEIQRQNPNRKLWTRISRKFFDIQNRVKSGQRNPDPPNLDVTDIEDSKGVKMDALDLGRNARFMLRHEFPLSGDYEIRVRGRAAKARSGAALRVVIDGQPVPARLAFSEGGKDVGLHVARVRVPRGRRSIEVSTVSSARVLFVSIEIAGPTITASRTGISCAAPASPGTSSARDCALRTIRDLAPRAFRAKSVTDAEIDALVAPFDKAIGRGEDFSASLASSIQAVLMSPRFLYRIESANGGSERVDDFEFATRLAFFLWGTPPDNQLRDAASRQTLVNSPDAIRAEVKRMLADDRAGEGLAVAFGQGWLGYGRLRTHAVDTTIFPGFDEELRYAMLRETELFLRTLFQENWPVSDLIDSRTLFVNERLARHYGVTNIQGEEFRRLQSPLDTRRGLLSEGSILTITSASNRTSVVKRGFWLLDKILCERVNDPPAGVQGLPDDGLSGEISLRQEMLKHRSKPECAGCHDRLDPIGFSLENYGGIGAWRKMDARFPIDASGTLQTARGPVQFHDFVELRGLLKDDERVPQCVTTKLMTYALGRDLSDADRAAVAEITARTRASGHRIHDIITEIALSAPFRTHSR